MVWRCARKNAIPQTDAETDGREHPENPKWSSVEVLQAALAQLGGGMWPRDLPTPRWQEPPPTAHHPPVRPPPPPPPPVAHEQPPTARHPAPWSAPSARPHAASSSTGGSGEDTSTADGALAAGATAAAGVAGSPRESELEERLQRCMDEHLGVLEYETTCCPFSKRDGGCRLLRLKPLKRDSPVYDPELATFVQNLLCKDVCVAAW